MVQEHYFITSTQITASTPLAIQVDRITWELYIFFTVKKKKKKMSVDIVC